jgi:hypothetical protein
MTQNSVTSDNEALYEGQNIYPGIDEHTVSKKVGETLGLNFGRFSSVGTDDELYQLRSNLTTLTLGGALASSDVLSGNLIVNGTTVAYTETYATSSAATVAALAAELAAVDGIASAVVSGSDLIITLTADPETDIHFSTGSAVGGNAPSVTLANDTNHSNFGVTEHAQVEQNSDGAALYEDDVMASVKREGYIVVRADEAMTPGDPVYVIFYDDSSAADKRAGMVRKTDGVASNKTLAKLDSNVEVYKACSAGAPCVLRVK